MEKRTEREKILQEMKEWLVSINSWSKDDRIPVEIPEWLKIKIDELDDAYQLLRED